MPTKITQVQPVPQPEESSTAGDVNRRASLAAAAQAVQLSKAEHWREKNITPGLCAQWAVRVIFLLLYGYMSVDLLRWTSVILLDEYLLEEKFDEEKADWGLGRLMTFPMSDFKATKHVRFAHALQHFLQIIALIQHSRHFVQLLWSATEHKKPYARPRLLSWSTAKLLWPFLIMWIWIGVVPYQVERSISYHMTDNRTTRLGEQDWELAFSKSVYPSELVLDGKPRPGSRSLLRSDEAWRSLLPEREGRPKSCAPMDRVLFPWTAMRQHLRLPHGPPFTTSQRSLYHSRVEGWVAVLVLLACTPTLSVAALFVERYKTCVRDGRLDESEASEIHAALLDIKKGMHHIDRLLRAVLAYQVMAVGYTSSVLLYVLIKRDTKEAAVGKDVHRLGRIPALQVFVVPLMLTVFLVVFVSHVNRKVPSDESEASEKKPRSKAKMEGFAWSAWLEVGTVVEVFYDVPSEAESAAVAAEVETMKELVHRPGMSVTVAGLLKMDRVVILSLAGIILSNTAILYEAGEYSLKQENRTSPEHKFMFTKLFERRYNISFHCKQWNSATRSFDDLHSHSGHNYLLFYGAEGELRYSSASHFNDDDNLTKMHSFALDYTQQIFQSMPDLFHRLIRDPEGDPSSTCDEQGYFDGLFDEEKLAAFVPTPDEEEVLNNLGKHDVLHKIYYNFGDEGNTFMTPMDDITIYDPHKTPITNYAQLFRVAINDPINVSSIERGHSVIMPCRERITVDGQYFLLTEPDRTNNLYDYVLSLGEFREIGFGEAVFDLIFVYFPVRVLEFVFYVISRYLLSMWNYYGAEGWQNNFNSYQCTFFKFRKYLIPEHILGLTDHCETEREYLFRKVWNCTT